MLFTLFSLLFIISNVYADYRKICYFTNWAQYREEPFNFQVSDIDATLCTHVIYSFVTINEFNQMSSVEENDIKMYKEFATLRTLNPDIILMLSIGGSKFDLSKMTYMLSSRFTRLTFISSSIQFLRLHGFDGLDLDFEYPGKPPSPLNDRERLTHFIKEMRSAIDSENIGLKDKRLLLTVAVPGNILYLETGFEIYEIAEYVDFITVMAHEYHSSSSVTGHNSALYGDSNVFNDTNNINETINYLERNQISPDQINLGIASYGRGFFLANPEDFGLGAAVKCASPGGPVTKEIGFMAYFEIQNYLDDENTNVYRFCDIQSPFLVNSNLWMSYDDEESLDIKMEYIKKRNLGGWSMWSIDFDDFRSFHGDPYPLLTKLNQLDDPKFKGSPLDCSNNTSLYIRTTDTPKSYRKVCYLTSWAKYRADEFKFTVDDVEPLLCTHVVYSFATINYHDLAYSEYADIEDYKKLNLLRVRNPDVKLLLALGGWTMDLTRLTVMLNSSASRSNFINSSINYLRKFNFDGLDLDVEHPGLKPSPPTDKQKFTYLIQEMSRAFKNETIIHPKKRLLLTIAIMATKTAVDTGFELAKIVNHVDYITLMTYDYCDGSWSPVTGHNSPLYGPYNLPDDMNNIDAMVEYFASKRVPYSMMNLGIPFYGRGFLLDSEEHFLGAPSKDSSPKEEYSSERGVLAYYEILKYLNESSTSIFLPCDIQVPFFVNLDLWVGYDDEGSIENKMKYAASKGLGGLSAWSIDFDDFKGVYGKPYPLLKKLNQIDDPAFLDSNNVVCYNGTLVLRNSRPIVSTTYKTTATTKKYVTARIRPTKKSAKSTTAPSLTSRNYLEIFLRKSNSNFVSGSGLMLAICLIVVYSYGYGLSLVMSVD